MLSMQMDRQFAYADGLKMRSETVPGEGWKEGRKERKDIREGNEITAWKANQKLLCTINLLRAIDHVKVFKPLR